MKTIIILLCLGLIGCATTSKESRSPYQAAKKLQSVAGKKQTDNAKYISPRELANIISIFDEALKNNPKYAGVYYYRAIAYFCKKDYNKSWQEIGRAHV